MKKIKLLPMKITSDVEDYLENDANAYCFDKIEEPFRIRDVGIIQVLHINGTEIYYGGLKTPACILFGGVPGRISEKDAFDVSTKETDYVFCFEPRVLMFAALALWISCHGGDPSDTNEVMEPLPSFEEATEFLKKNGIFNENHIFQYSDDVANLTEELRFIPEDIKKRIKRVLDRNEKERLEEEQG